MPLAEACPRTALGAAWCTTRRAFRLPAVVIASQVGFGGWCQVGEAVFEPPAGSVDGDDVTVVQKLSRTAVANTSSVNTWHHSEGFLLVMMMDPFSYRWEMSWKT